MTPDFSLSVHEPMSNPKDRIVNRAIGFDREFYRGTSVELDELSEGRLVTELDDLFEMLADSLHLHLRERHRP